MLAEDVLFPDGRNRLNPHPILENYLKLFALPLSRHPFDTQVFVSESKLFLAQKKFPDLWEPIMKQAIKNTLPTGHTFKTPKKIM